MKYTLHLSGRAEATVTITSDKTDPQEILDEFNAQEIPSVSILGANYALLTPESWDVIEDEDETPAIYVGGKRYVPEDEK